MASFLNQLTKEDYIVLEASTNTFWFYDLVRERVKECVVINPRKFRLIKDSFKKTDKIDSRKLAKMLR